MPWLGSTITGRCVELTQHGNCAEIKRVACARLEGADPSLAQDDLLVADREDVFGCPKPLIDGAGEAALEQDRTVDLAELAQEVEVLHVAGADLQDVNHLRHAPDLIDGHHLADDRHAGRPAGGGKQFEAVPAESLKCVRRGARLEDAAAENLRAGFAHRPGGGGDLVCRLDRTRAGHDQEATTADQQVANRDHRVIRARTTSGKPVFDARDAGRGATTASSALPNSWRWDQRGGIAGVCITTRRRRRVAAEDLEVQRGGAEVVERVAVLGSAMFPSKSMKNRYSNGRPGRGRDSSFVIE